MMRKWTEQEENILQSCLDDGMSLDNIVANGIFPDRTRESIRRKVFRIVHGETKLKTIEKTQYEKEIQKLYDQVTDLKRKYREALRYAEFEDAVLDAFREYCTPYTPVAPPVPREALDGMVQESVCAVLSDWHFWEVVSSADTGGLAEYNMNIAAGYMQHLAETTIDITKHKLQGYEFSDLHVFLLGDIVSTNLHGLMEHSQGNAVRSLLEGQYLVASYLLDMCRSFAHVYVYGVPGNHGRLTEKKRYKSRYANWDYLLYKELAYMLQDQPNITFDIPQSFFQLVEVEGYTFLLLHGDDFRAWNQIPWYGIMRGLRRFSEILSANGRYYEYVVFAHIHNSGDLESPRGEILLNGSAIGTTDYSLGKLFTGNKPHQMVFGVHKEHGISWRFNIKLKQPDQQRYVLPPLDDLHRHWIEKMRKETP